MNASQPLHEAAERAQLIVSTRVSLLVDELDPQQVIVVNHHDGETLFHRSSSKLHDWLKEYTLGRRMSWGGCRDEVDSPLYYRRRTNGKEFADKALKQHLAAHAIDVRPRVVVTNRKLGSVEASLISTKSREI